MQSIKSQPPPRLPRSSSMLSPHPWNLSSATLYGSREMCFLGPNTEISARSKVPMSIINALRGWEQLGQIFNPRR